MSRSGYDYDLDQWQLIMYRGSVASALRGKRGQAFLRDLLDALDALPEKQLIAADLEKDGQVCALGALGKARNIDMNNLDPHDSSTIAGTFNIADCLAREVVYENDEGFYNAEPPEHRFERMRSWVIAHIKRATVSA